MFVLISGLFSLIVSCNTKPQLSEKDKLIQRFFSDNIKQNKGKKIYIAVISTACEDCINTNIHFINNWEQKGLPLTYLMDSDMANEISDKAKGLSEKCRIVDANVFIKYGITEGRMLVMYANDDELEEIDLIPDGVKTYSFRQ